MKLHEHQAKAIFARCGIPVPGGRLAETPAAAAAAVADLGGRAVLKAQVHAGGRGLAGGVRVVSSPDEARDYAASLLGARLVTHQTDAAGVPVAALLVEELADIAREMYLALAIDRATRSVMLIASAARGVSIEEVAASRPDAIITETDHPASAVGNFCKSTTYRVHHATAATCQQVDIVRCQPLAKCRCLPLMFELARPHHSHGRNSCINHGIGNMQQQKQLT